MRIALALALAIAAIGCAPRASVAETPPPAVAPADLAHVDADACDALGGEIRPVCRLQRPMCVIRFADAGKACRSGSDCAGDCRAPDGVAPGAAVTGQCQATSDPCGCRAKVENGVVGAALCVD